MNDPLISIVIPTYNRENFIAIAIKSLLAQTQESFEIIVVDDGSTDKTAEVVRAFPDPRLTYHYKKNGERAAARNYGAKQAKGKFVGFLDSDDYVYPNHIAVAEKYITSNQGAKVFHIGFEIRNASGKLLETRSRPGTINNIILSGNPLGCSGVFIERSTLLEIPFNEDRKLSALEDWELWIRLAARFPFASLPEITSVLVQHDERSVMSGDETQITSMVDTFCEIVATDLVNRSVYGSKINRAIASARTYAALHIVIGGNKDIAFKYLQRGISDDPSVVFTRRFIVIVLYLLGLRK